MILLLPPVMPGIWPLGNPDPVITVWVPTGITLILLGDNVGEGVGLPSGIIGISCWPLGPAVQRTVEQHWSLGSGWRVQ
jgi:hypothetical protein